MTRPYRISAITAAINITPMVDVMLVLLVIFMVITPMLKARVPVDLALARNAVDLAGAGQDDALIVTVMHDGGIFLAMGRVTDEELRSKVSERLSDQSRKTIYIRSDGRAPYKFVARVVNAVRDSGVEDVGLLTELKHPGALR